MFRSRGRTVAEAKVWSRGVSKDLQRPPNAIPAFAEMTAWGERMSSRSDIYCLIYSAGMLQCGATVHFKNANNLPLE